MIDPHLASRLCDSVLLGEFVLPDGEIVDAYFDEYRMSADPDLLAAVAQRLALRVSESGDLPDALAAIATGGVALATLMSQQLGLPLVIVRLPARSYGTATAVEGADVAGRRVAIVDSVLGTGKAAAATIAALRDHNAATVDRLAVVLDRQRGGARAMDDLGVAVRSLVSWDELLHLRRRVRAS